MWPAQLFRTPRSEGSWLVWWSVSVLEILDIFICLYMFTCLHICKSTCVDVWRLEVNVGDFLLIFWDAEPMSCRDSPVTSTHLALVLPGWPLHLAWCVCAGGSIYGSSSCHSTHVTDYPISLIPLHAFKQNPNVFILYCILQNREIPCGRAAGLSLEEEQGAAQGN